MSIFNINLETCTEENYRAVYNYLKSKQQTPDELFSPMTISEIELLTPVFGVMPALSKMSGLNLAQERQVIIESYADQESIKKSIMMQPQVIDFAYLSQWTKNGAFDMSPTSPKSERLAVLPFHFEFKDGQTLNIFFDVDYEKGLAMIDPINGSRIEPNAVARIKPVKCFLNHMDITEILGEYGNAGSNIFWNLKRCSLLVSLNRENARNWQGANRDGLSELFVEFSRLSDLKMRTGDYYPFVHGEFIASRLKSFSNERFSPLFMATQLKLGMSKYYSDIERQKQEVKDAEEDRKKIAEFEKYQDKRETVQRALDEYWEFDKECREVLARQLQAKRDEINALLKQNGIIGKVPNIDPLPPMTKPQLKVLEMPESWKSID